MTLHVSFEQFPKTVAHLLASQNVFVAAQGFGSLVTAADPEKGILIVCKTDHTPASAKSKLSGFGLDVLEGAWKLTDEIPVEQDGSIEAFVAAVSYKSGENMPGLWIDAYPALPTQVQVLRAMHEEFRHTGELAEVSFEEFVRLSEPNVIILSPHDVQSFLDKKKDC